MRELKLKEVKRYNAIDLSDRKHDELIKLMKEEGGFEKIGLSFGIYGRNGAVLQGNKTGELYKIVGRCGALFSIVN